MASQHAVVLLLGTSSRILGSLRGCHSLQLTKVMVLLSFAPRQWVVPARGNNSGLKAVRNTVFIGSIFGGMKGVLVYEAEPLLSRVVLS